jgi:hypothetical protein
MKIIALEEHYWDPEVAKHFDSFGPEMKNPALRDRLHDLGALRIKDMDEAGIDVQVLSHGAPATQRLDAATAVPVAKGANDRLHAAIQKNPTRLKAFAILPSADPKAAADELERAVTKLGFKGAMLHGLDKQGRFLDLKEFWPIYERAAKLDVPIYMHPAVPHKAVVDAYYRDYLEQFPGLLTAAWGFTVETATQGIRGAQAPAAHVRTAPIVPPPVTPAPDRAVLISLDCEAPAVCEAPDQGLDEVHVPVREDDERPSVPAPRERHEFALVSAAAASIERRRNQSTTSADMLASAIGVPTSNGFVSSR